MLGPESQCFILWGLLSLLSQFIELFGLLSLLSQFIELICFSLIFLISFGDKVGFFVPQETE